MPGNKKNIKPKIELLQQELAAKKHELRIEKALDSVRAVALKMKEPDDMLKICKTISQHLQKLGVKEIRNVQTAIFYEEKGSYMNYEFYAKHNKTFITDTLYTNHKIAKAFGEKMQKGKGQFFVTHIKGKKVKDWIAYQKTTNVFIDKYLNKATSLNYYWYSLGPVALGISTYEPLTKENSDLFLRFLNVFELAYRRYLDIEKAEAQAREAQIEAALERVRSRTMAMHKSEELAEVATVLFEQVSLLDDAPERFNIRIINEEERAFEFWATDQEGHLVNKFFKADFDKSPVVQQMYSSWKAKEKILIQDLHGDQLSEWVHYIKDVLGVPFNIEHLKEHRFLSSFFFSHGMIGITTNDTPGQKTLNLIDRFAKVFEQTYTRFLDLKKAEAQAREAQIELGLERVRARAMAMQSSNELKELIGTVSSELTKLDVVLDRCFIAIFDPQTKDSTWWMASPETPSNPKGLFMKYHEMPAYLANLRAWNERQVKWQYILEGKIKKKWDDYIFSQTDFSCLPDFVIANMKSNERVYLNASFNSFGCLSLATLEPLLDEHFDILLRFAKVFELTYTRFNDLQKAEAQARESQIQLALERVRARTMAMQKSEELPETSLLLFQQVKELGMTAVQNSIGIVNEEAGFVELSTTVHGHNLPHTLNVPIDDPYVMAKAIAAWKAKHKSLKLVFEGQELKDYNEHRNSFFETKVNFPEDQWVVNLVFFSKGWLSFSSNKDLSGKIFDILTRFTAVFEQTYTRFNDLQKAEAQAREAQIEASLERVRSRTMAMHKSEELVEVINEVFKQLQKLDFKIDTASFSLNYKETPFNIWMAAPNQPYPTQINIPEAGISLMNCIREAIANKLDFYSHSFSFEEKNQWIHHIINTTIVKDASEERKKLLLGAPGIAISVAMLNHIALIIGNYSVIPYSAEENTIIKRFAQVFEQTYIRFLDLQKAEAQAREAQIEAALEKVRSRTMAMQRSDELSETAAVLFQEFKKLGEKDLLQITIGLYNEADGLIESRVTSWAGGGEQVDRPFNLSIEEPALLKPVFTAWKENKKSIVVDLSGKQLEEWLKYRNANMGVTVQNEDTGGRRVVSVAFFSKGHISFSSAEPRSPEVIQLLERFAGVFDLTYTRFLDLQKAEAQAREAQIEASLERVRARTMAMQRSDELPEAANNLFIQIHALGIPAWSAGYCIWENENKTSATLNMSSEGVLQKPFSLPSIGVGYDFLSPVQKSEQFYVAELGGEELVRHYEFMRSLPVVGEVLDGIIEAGFPLPTFQIFHIVYFTHGYLMFITYEKVPESYEIFKRFARVFEQTYTRFLDLHTKEEQANRIAAEKERLEKTLNDLQHTQKQLIQSEKMASLGELTAGIAHEIQNPLNFVNNFSDVSNELLEEMKTELQKGNTEDAMAIANDVKQNLEKILHHGKRADAIVKGMLQHSRSSSGVKEPTNINTLADEYLRLAYHGLRAKDKTFNATMNTGYEESIGNISIIPQDIGRVVLNLITNAFYAVTEKKKQQPEGYEPTVTVSTKKINGKVEINVADNGNGIPQKILDKIFQPFFTTKPTGQGTGLGLSLSYDIVKAHGGEIKVNTKENEGTELIIQLPITL